MKLEIGKFYLFKNKHDTNLFGGEKESWKITDGKFFGILDRYEMARIKKEDENPLFYRVKITHAIKISSLKETSLIVSTLKFDEVTLTSVIEIVTLDKQSEMNLRNIYSSHDSGIIISAIF